MRKMKMNLKKQLSLGFLFLVGLQASFGQAVDGLNAANQEIRTYITPVTNIILGIGVIIGLVGAVKVFMAWNSGEQNVAKLVMGWFGSCLFLVLSSVIVQSFFA